VTASRPELRQVLKAIGWSIAFLLCGLAFTTLLLWAGAAVVGRGVVSAGMAVLQRP